jgi:D-xylonolactonase
MLPAPRLLHDTRCALGENPLWDARHACLHWVDIPAGRIHRLNPTTGEHRVLHEGGVVGGFTLQADGNLLLFRTNDVVALTPSGRLETIARLDDEGAARFNDVIADPEGRVFAGTIGVTEASGGLYRLDRDGELRLMFRGTGCSNGMGFSPDRRTFYWTCSSTRRIYAFDYVQQTGDLRNRRILYQAGPDEGIPDGLAVDATGHLWSARWDGFALVHHDAAGRVIETIRFPVARVTSVCFGGEKLDRMFVTTAGGGAGSDTHDGSIFELVISDVAGSLEFLSRVRA